MTTATSMNASTRPHGRAQIQNIFNEAHEMTLLAKQTTIALMGRRKMLDLGPVRRSVCKFPREVAQFARTDWCRVPDGQHKARPLHTRLSKPLDVIYSSVRVRAASMPIRKYIAGSAFDPEAIARMTTALEGVRTILNIHDPNDPMVETVAKKIVSLASEGI